MQIKRNQNNNFVEKSRARAVGLSPAAVAGAALKERTSASTDGNANHLRPIHFYYFVLFQLYVITDAIVA